MNPSAHVPASPAGEAYADVVARLSDALDSGRVAVLRLDDEQAARLAVLGALRGAWGALRSDISTPGAYRQIAALGDARTAVPWPFRDRLTYKLAVHPDDIRAAIQAAPVRRVRVLDPRICSIQRTCSVARIAQYLHEPALAAGRKTAAGTPQDIPNLVAYRGTLFLYDGNHRMMRAWLDGATHARVRLADLDAAVAKKGSTKVQTLVFKRPPWTRKRAVAWAKTHDYKASDVDETETSYRLRQRDPARFVAGSFRTIALAAGVSAVIGKLK